MACEYEDQRPMKKLLTIRSCIGWLSLLAFVAGLLDAMIQLPPATMLPLVAWLAMFWLFLTTLSLFLMGIKMSYALSKISLITAPFFVYFWSLQMMWKIGLMGPLLRIFFIGSGFVWPVVMLVDVVFYFIHKRLINQNFDSRYPATTSVS